MKRQRIKVFDGKLASGHYVPSGIGKPTTRVIKMGSNSGVTSETSNGN
jgi:hypothetical protein